MTEPIKQSSRSVDSTYPLLDVLADVLDAISDRHERICAKTGVYDAFGSFPGAEAVAEYIVKYRRDDLPSFVFGGPYDLFPADSLPYGVITPFTWETSHWPSAHRAGVYLIYSVGLQLLYIGKARNLSKQLYDHFGGNRAICSPRGIWPIPPRFVITVAVPEDMPFEAGALEEYLIWTLGPATNTHGINR